MSLNLNNIGVVVLAAGRGTRLGCVDKPKVMLKIGGAPIVGYVIETLKKIGFTKEQIVLVVGFQEEAVREYFGDSVTYAQQAEQKGTAHAAYVGMRILPANIEQVLVINGDDSAFYASETIKNLIYDHLDGKAVVTLLAVNLDNAEGYSRVIQGSDGKTKIIEKEYLTDEQKNFNLVSTGTFVIDRTWFEKIFPTLPPLRKLGEYALPTAFAVAQEQGEKVGVITLVNNNEWFGINTSEELAEADKRKF
jgi:bifunctional N-acetylglucosamine-1-phosphate-uridyltransferase/glucosamine-1-phosphate-acetyltransferase GlmU-like protein